MSVYLHQRKDHRSSLLTFDLSFENYNSQIGLSFFVVIEQVI